MAPTRGKVLESVPLYSEHCAILLKQALKIVQAKDSPVTTSASTFQARYASSSDEEAAERSDESSSSTTEEDEAVLEEERDTFDLNDVSKSLAAQPSAKEPKRRTKKSKAEMDQRQNDLLIRTHTDSLPCIPFDLPDDDRALELPSCLLSKEDFLSESLVPQCRSYLALATALAREAPVVVLFLRSGRFAGAIFCRDACTQHRTSVRYTVRKGQGKAQSAQDSQRRAQSMGAQLRRQGEISLQQDVAAALKEWRDYIQQAALILISVPRTMQKGLFDDSCLKRDDARIRRVPLDLGRPTFESACLIYSVLTTVTVRERVAVTEQLSPVTQDNRSAAVVDAKEAKPRALESEPKEETIPPSELHIAAQNGDVEAIKSILESDAATEQIKQHAGEFFMTPLHYAAESSAAATVDPLFAANCVQLLLEHGRADPCSVDSRRRVPYFLATHDKVRDAFRIARANLGEDYCPWDEGAKVGPPLTQQAMDEKNEKEAEKRRKKRAKQKEKRAQEKAETKEADDRRLEAEERQKQEDEAKRVRDGLTPKVGGGGVCDFCQTVCQGRKRAQMIKRLEYCYCCSDCVQKHKRELMAAAATARMGG